MRKAGFGGLSKRRCVVAPVNEWGGDHCRRGVPRGYDGVNRPSGRTRHWLVDALSLVVKAPVGTANISDGEEAIVVVGVLRGCVIVQKGVGSIDRGSLSVPTP